ncbi:MAG TPA: FecR family protein [Polyangia bacterium]|nr:FecR family protein [Polyangia bacterium]
MIEEGAPDQALARLRPRWTDARAEHNLARALARIEGGRRLTRALAVAGAAASLAFAFVQLRRAPVAHRASPIARAATEQLASPSRLQLQLDDGSTIALGARAHVRIASTSRERIELELADGPATFAIPARAGRAVVVHMARFDVTILAAAFTLAPFEDRARVDVTSGDVEVRWSSGRAVVHAGRDALLPAPVVASSPVAPRAVPDAEALMRDADAARRAGRPAAAVPYYRRLLRAFPSDERAPVAAFTLGRVLLTQLDRPDEAADAFATSRRLAPAGALADDAWAREVEAAARAGETDRARGLARAYLARHGDEPRATAVRRAGGLE